MQVIIEADGGSRGNPGIAGSGTAIFDADHKTELSAISYAVGTATNNVAEYHGLLNGLQKALELGATKADIRMDSKLVVEQMSGRWKIKHPDMKKLALKCQELLQQFDQTTFTWIPRSENARADQLANLAMDALADGTVKAGEVLQTQAAEVGADADKTTQNPGKTPSHKKPTDNQAAGAKIASPSSWNGATSRPTRLLLLRHGQTEMSVHKLYSGRSNPPLTEQGLWQAHRAADRIAARGGLAGIISSPLQRCQQTAQAVADQLGVPVITWDELVEVDFGTWEGLSFSQAHESDPELHARWLADPSIAPPQGESLLEVNHRVTSAREKLEEQFPGQTVLVVSHVSPIKAIISQALGAPVATFNRLHLDLASFSIAEFYADGPTCVRLVNDCSHLKT